MRRSFRVGLRIGVLVGVVFAMVKVLQSRRSADDARPDGPTGGGWAGGDTSWTPPPPPPRAAPATAVRDANPGSAALAGVDAGLAAEVRDLTPAADTETPMADRSVPAPAPPRAAAPDPAPTAAPAPPPARPPRTRPLVARPPASQASSASTASSGSAARASSVPPAKKAAKAAKAKKALPAEVWVEPTGSTCPPSHPVKAKLSSRLFHLPGMFAYDRTRPDRCYSGPDTAAEDGFVQAKR